MQRGFGDMELWRLWVLVEPASLALVSSSVGGVLLAAYRALAFEKEADRNRETDRNREEHNHGGFVAPFMITLSGSQAMFIPVACSCSLMIMFYLFSSVSLVILGIASLMSVLSLAFTVGPCLSALTVRFRCRDPVVVDSGIYGLWTRSHVLLALGCIGVVVCWLVTGNWLLNNMLGVSLVVGVVSYIRLPNIRICVILLMCLLLYDVFWVYFSKLIFGSNVMVEVATRQTTNPFHTFTNTFNLQNLSQVIVEKLDLPYKLIFPRDLQWGGESGAYMRPMLLGLGDMAIPGMVLSLVLCHDHRRGRDPDNEGTFMKGIKYIHVGGCSYFVGITTALAVGALWQAPQPALLFLAPSILGSLIFLAWRRGELAELWGGSRPIVIERSKMMEP